MLVAEPYLSLSLSLYCVRPFIVRFTCENEQKIIAIAALMKDTQIDLVSNVVHMLLPICIQIDNTKRRCDREFELHIRSVAIGK